MAPTEGGEFAFIERLVRQVGTPGRHPVGIGDDAAVLDDGTLVAVDTIVHGRHVDLAWTSAESIGWKALVVNLSDIAAMGGEPTAAVAAVTLPADRADLADHLAAGLIEASRAFGCPLVGGDTTSGPELVLSITVLGRMPDGLTPVLRSGARPGDTVFVSGRLGAAAATLDELLAGREPNTDRATALHWPNPRLAQGRAAARGGATAMIDVSDGLGADLGHILDSSGVGATIVGDDVPLAASVTLDRAFAGGDDYELCFTAPDVDAIRRSFERADLPPPSAIGQTTDSERTLSRHGRLEPLPSTGWTHPIP